MSSCGSSSEGRLCLPCMSTLARMACAHSCQCCCIVQGSTTCVVQRAVLFGGQRQPTERFCLACFTSLYVYFVIVCYMVVQLSHITSTPVVQGYVTAASTADD
jgi:hypothetical protein